MPKLRQQQSTSALPSVRPGPTPLSHPPPSAQKTTSHLPRASIYGSIPGTPTSGYAPSTASTSSTVTVTNHSRKTSTALSHREDDFQADPMSSAGADADVEDSPTAKLLKARPNTSMASRRTSMLPQPRRTVSGQSDAVAAAASAMTGRTSRAGVGRRTSMPFGTSAEGKPRWRGA
jgi:hypothetical protein